MSKTFKEELAEKAHKVQQEARNKEDRDRAEKHARAQQEQDVVFRNYTPGLRKKCETAAANGKTHYMVMRLEIGRDYGKHNGNELPYYNLNNGAKRVYDEIVDVLKLDAKIVHDHDGVGISSWYNLFATWAS